MNLKEMTMCSHMMEAESHFFDFSTVQSAYTHMGAHSRGACVLFRAFAPCADAVYLVGTFNLWKQDHPMHLASAEGIWEIELPSADVPDGSEYKFLICRGEDKVYKTDPYALQIGDKPYCNSVYINTEAYEIQTGEAGISRCTSVSGDRPVRIYSLSCEDAEAFALMSYSDMARELAPYLCQMCYTHVCISDIFEKYTDGFYLTDCTAYYCAKQKRGGIKELRSFSDIMHSYGIGVILDWKINGNDVLCEDKGKDFFASNASFWLSKTSADGLIFSSDGCVDKEVAAYIVEKIKSTFPDKWICADSIDICRDVQGFDATIDRKWTSRTNNVLFPDFKADRILTIPMNDTRYGNNKLYECGFADEWQKWASARVFTAYMMTSRGKKLTLCGEETGALRGDASQQKKENAEFQLFCSDIGEVYLRFPELWQESSVETARVVSNVSDPQLNIFARKAGESELIVILNFSPDPCEDGRLTVNGESEWYEVINSDNKRYGGSGVTNEAGIRCVPEELDGKKATQISLRIPPMGVSVLGKKTVSNTINIQ